MHARLKGLLKILAAASLLGTLALVLPRGDELGYRVFHPVVYFAAGLLVGLMIGLDWLRSSARAAWAALQRAREEDAADRREDE